MDLNNFKSESFVLNNDNFWLYIFVMCYALYAPMRVLRLADQQVPGMEKLYYYILQTDWMLLRWLPDAEMRVSALRRDGTYNHAMNNMEEYVFDEEAADSSGDDHKEEDSDDDDDCLVRDDNVDNDADEESEDDNSLFGTNVISLQE
jgi:hypothetical protein